MCEVDHLIAYLGTAAEHFRRSARRAAASRDSIAVAGPTPLSQSTCQYQLLSVRQQLTATANLQTVSIQQVVDWSNLYGLIGLDVQPGQVGGGDRGQCADLTYFPIRSHPQEQCHASLDHTPAASATEAVHVASVFRFFGAEQQTRTEDE